MTQTIKIPRELWDLLLKKYFLSQEWSPKDENKVRHLIREKWNADYSHKCYSQIQHAQTKTTFDFCVLEYERVSGKKYPGAWVDR